MRQAGNTAWDFAASRRSNGAGLAKSCDSYSAMGRTWNLTGHSMVKIITLPLAEIAFGASGQMRVHVLLERDLDQPILVGADLDGGNGARVLMTATAGTKELVTLNFGMDPQRSATFKGTPALNLYLIARNASASTAVTIHSISAFEPQNLPLRPKIFRDTTGATNVIGAADQPLSAFVRTLVANQQRVLHWARAAKSNIITQCFVSGRLSGFTTYSTDLDRLGRWIVRKPYGGDSITFVTNASISTGSVELKASLYSLATLDYDGEVSAFTAGDILEDNSSGARARIVKVTDAGTTGTLYLAYVTGSFGNNDALKGRNSTTGDLRGEALQNGAIRAGELVDSDAVTITTADAWESFTLDTVNEDAEYEIRFDVEKISGVAVTVNSFIVAAHVENSATTIAHRIPRSSECEQDDPIRASTYKAIKDTQNATWHNQRAIILSDFRAWNRTVKAAGRYEVFYLNDTFESLAAGVLYKAPRTQVVKARLVVSKPDLTFYRKMDVNSDSGEWVEGETLTGATSGATAQMVFAQAALGWVYFKNENGAFAVGETVSTPSGYAAIVDAPSQRFEGSQKIRLAIGHTEDEAIASKEFDASMMGRGKPMTLEMSVDVPTDYFDNDSTVVGDYPLLWTLYAVTTEPGDAITLEQYQVFQAPLTTLDAELHEDEQ